MCVYGVLFMFLFNKIISFVTASSIVKYVMYLFHLYRCLFMIRSFYNNILFNLMIISVQNVHAFYSSQMNHVSCDYGFSIHVFNHLLITNYYKHYI